MKQLFVFFYFTLLFFNILYSDTSEIYKINYEKIENDNIQLKVIFLENYSGDIVKKSGNNFKKVILNNATTEDFLSKKFKNSFISEINVISSVTKTEFLFYSKYKIKLEVKQIKSKEVMMRVSKIQTNDSISPEGTSMFDNLPLSYIMILTILIITMLIIFIKNQKLDLKSKIPSISSNVIKTVVNNAATTSSLVNSQIPFPSFNQPIQPKQHNFNEFHLTKISKNENLEAINIQEKYPSPFNIQNRKPEHPQPHRPVSKSTVQTAKNNKIITNEKEQENTRIKKMLSSKNVKIIFDDDLDKGNVSMFQVGSRKYLIYEADSGELLLLDKFETIRKNTKKSSPQNTSLENAMNNISKISKTQPSLQAETISKKNFLNDKNNNIEIKLPKLENIAKHNKKDKKNQLNAIFD